MKNSQYLRPAQYKKVMPIGPLRQSFSEASRQGFVSPILLALVALLLVGGGAYEYVHTKKQGNKATTEVGADTKATSTTQTSGLTSSNNQNDELIKTKFELAILKFWQVDVVFRNPQNKNKFYYVSEDSSGNSIWVYDLAKDKTYQKDGYFNIPEGNTMLLNQKLAQYQEFRGVGIVDNKFVFVETSSDNSPGPCFSLWFYSNLEYIDLGISKPTRKPFTLPQDLKRTEEQKASECENAII